MTEEILVQYNDENYALFGPDNAAPGDNIDTEASRAKFATMLEAEVVKAFPHAIVKIKARASTTYGLCEAWREDGTQDTEALYIVREILRETWASFNWLVDAN